MEPRFAAQRHQTEHVRVAVGDKGRQQFQLLGIDRTIQDNNTKTRFSINGKRKYVRVIIINKKTNGEKIQACNK